MSYRNHPAFWPTYQAVLCALYANNCKQWLRTTIDMVMEAEEAAKEACEALGVDDTVPT